MVDHAAKVLRGRSFFIKLLCDTVADYIVRKLDLLDSNLFFSNGGHFVILAPSDPETLNKLAELEKQINQFLIEEFSGKIQIVISSIEKDAESIIQSFDETMIELDEKLNNAKKQKSLSVLHELVLEAKEPTKKNHDKLFENLGTELPKSKYLIRADFDSLLNFFAKNHDEMLIFRKLGIILILVRENELENELSRLQSLKPERITIFSDSPEDFLKPLEMFSSKITVPLACSFRYTGSTIPKDDYGQPLTFEKLAELNSKDYPLIGIARMDVDSLGKIFRDGLKIARNRDINSSSDERNLYTVSRIATLSRELGLFFSCGVKEIAERHDIYLVYSGGDDLFAVGSWINIINFSKEVRSKFREFVCANDNLTISCGLSFSRSSYPISRAAFEAGERLDDAKAKDKKLKNKISIFGREISWDELEDYLSHAENLIKIIEPAPSDTKGINRSFIHDLLEMTSHCINKDGSMNLSQIIRTNSKMYYHFSRRGMGYEEIEKKESSFKKDFATMFLTKNHKQLQSWYENFIIPASYVLLKTRKLTK